MPTRNGNPAQAARRREYLKDLQRREKRGTVPTQDRLQRRNPVVKMALQPLDVLAQRGTFTAPGLQEGADGRVPGHGLITRIGRG
jgi:hypothetical protein